jgi:rhodanese-related sulfurtransferase
MKRFNAVGTVVLLLVSALCLGALAFAASDEVARITIEELKKLMDNGVEVTVLDVQPKSAFDKGHIKGAVSIPWTPKLNRAQTGVLPRNKPIVVYCDCGPGETDSANIAERLLDFGFKDVKVLKDPSVRGWKEAGYPTE